MFQSDRDRFLLTGVSPPGPLKRLTVHCIVPATIFLMAGLGAIHIQDALLNQTVSCLLVGFLVVYGVVQCWKGRAKRKNIRKDLLFTKYQILQQQQQHDHHADLSLVLEQERPQNDDDDYYYMGQTAWDISCAHPCCLVGCYAQDSASSASSTTKPLLPACCGMHVQCCGMCAVAQEARELETVVLPAAYRRIDYITMQPILEYYPAIYRHKQQRSTNETRAAAAADNLLLPNDDDNNSNNHTTTRMPPLSTLSFRLLQWLGLILGLALAWSILGPLYWKFVAKDHLRARIAFNLADMAVLSLIFVQAFGLTAILSFLCNRPLDSQLSVDAMIKLFGSGFFLSTSLAMFWEVVLGLLVRLLVSLALAVQGVDVMDDPDTSVAWQRANALAGATGFLQSFGKDHVVLYTLYIFVATFLLAAAVEEVCKYFGYRMCDDHPDFLSRRELRETHREEHDDETEQQQQQEEDFDNHRQSKQAQGAALTLAMISAAMGFSCCENLVYVFVYSSGSPRMELSVLAARSLFPVHPICAALQSLRVCQETLLPSAAPQLRNNMARLWRLLLPAVVVHGTYDFLLVWIDYLAGRHDAVAEDDDVAMGVVNDTPVAAVLSTLLTLAWLVAAVRYYGQHAARQREALKDLDQRALAEQSNLL